MFCVVSIDRSILYGGDDDSSIVSVYEQSFTFIVLDEYGNDFFVEVNFV